MRLNNSRIFRGGITASELSLVPGDYEATINPLDFEILHVQFDLASKGGGTTSVLLKIGKNDLKAIMKEIARKMPESASIFLDCAAVANRKNLELLKQARKEQPATPS